MGLMIEASLLAQVHGCVTTFSNMDLLLRGLGYSLFEIISHRCSRAALPLIFHWREPADTHSGQTVWADCLYFRDAAISAYERDWRVAFDDQKLRKLACLYDFFCYPDWQSCCSPSVIASPPTSTFHAASTC
jgi:hypothetical protein